jgi:predicted nuclease of restriction endonuclease-like (RecB) superfamily
MSAKRTKRPSIGAKRRAGGHARAAAGETLSRKSILPNHYAELLDELKASIRRSQIKASLSVNRELIGLYWHIGRSIAGRQEAEGWGKSIVDRLAGDIQRSFPGIAGFSSRNIWRMLAFHRAWSRTTSAKLPGGVTAILPQAVAELPPSAVAEIPWGHNVALLEKINDGPERLWYAEQVVAHGWSRAILVHQIESDLYRRSGRAVSNFAATLPAPDSDLAHQLLKDPYNFDFLILRPGARERDLEAGLIEHLKTFLLELGVGFAFVGQQYPIEVDGEDYYLDLLFYHLKLRRYLVIDLKMEGFQPEFAGKMNFYLSVVDERLRNGDDLSSIGLILCRSQNRLVAEYALRDTGKPMGVATYTTALPAPLRGSLPSTAQLTRELTKTRRPTTGDREH